MEGLLIGNRRGRNKNVIMPFSPRAAFAPLRGAEQFSAGCYTRACKKVNLIKGVICATFARCHQR
jgi:hypothetical protein